METIILIISIGIMNILCFFIGAKIGQKVVKGEEIKAPDISKLNPINIQKKREEKYEVEKEKNKLETISIYITS